MFFGFTADDGCRNVICVVRVISTVSAFQSVAERRGLTFFVLREQGAVKRTASLIALLETMNETHESMPNMVPLISVLMTVYNRQEFLKAALHSILDQTLRDFEFIIVDDGSTDGSTAILRDYAAREPRIRLLVKENQGLIQALNDGLDLARGEFIARMDSDDVARPNRFAKQIGYLQSHPEVVCLGSCSRYMDANGVPLFNRRMPLSHEQIDAFHLGGIGGWIQHPTAMIRRSAFDKVGRYDARYLYAEDYELWFRLARVGKLANLPDVLLNYRLHADAVSQAKSREQMQMCKRIASDELSRRGLTSALPVPEDYQLRHTDPWWLLPMAVRSGCWKTAWNCLGQAGWRRLKWAKRVVAGRLAFRIPKM